MGLDMCLYRMKKSDFEKRKLFSEKQEEFGRKWNKLLRTLPYKDNGWEVDEEKLDPELASDLELCRKENAELDAEKPASWNAEEYHYWRKFNALHGYIVNTFADGVDECQTIEIGKDGVAKIVSALKKTLRMLKSKKGFDADELPVKPVGGFFFGSTDIDDYYKSNVEDAIKVFSELYESLADDETVFYEASW